MKNKFKPMSVKSIFLILFFLYTAPMITSGQTDQKDQFLARYYEILGDRFYQHRELEGHMRNSQKYYLSAQKISRNPARLYWKLSRGYWLRGERKVLSSEKKNYYQKGIDFGRRAIDLAPDSSMAHLWYALSMGKYVLEEGILKSLYRKDEVRKELEVALKLDRDNVKAYLGLAEWYFRVPPLIGGNKQYAYQLIQKGIKMDPKNTQALLIKSRFLIADGRLAEGIELLKEIMSKKEVASISNSIGIKISARSLLNQYSGPKSQ